MRLSETTVFFLLCFWGTPIIVGLSYLFFSEHLNAHFLAVAAQKWPKPLWEASLRWSTKSKTTRVRDIP